MVEARDWRDGVKVVRGEALRDSMRSAAGMGRATAFDFSGAGGQRTWIGLVTLAPQSKTGGHHHGRHEVAVYVVKGRSEIRWGERLEFAAEVGPGDFVYFAPGVPHQEANHSAADAVEFLVVRSDNERIVVGVDAAPAEKPELLF